MLLQTGHTRFPEIRRYCGRSVSFRTEQSVLFHGDGEVLGESPVEVENIPAAIRVIAPPRK